MLILFVIFAHHASIVEDLVTVSSINGEINSDMYEKFTSNDATLAR